MRPSILVATLVCSAAPVAAQDCEDWGASHFFSPATPEEVQSCLDAGADVNVRLELGATPLHMAANRTRHPEVITLLVEAGADVNARDGSGATPLHRARSAEVINALAAAGAEAEATDDRGRTALHLAAREARVSSTIAALVAVGADVNARDLTGRTALHEAAERGRAETIAALVAAGADVDSPDATGNTPLHLAARVRDPSVVALLLEAGADPRARNAAGETPLHRAIAAGNSEQVDALLRAGADPNSRPTDGGTPLHLVISREEPRAVDNWGMNPWVHERNRRENPHVLSEESVRRDTAMFGTLVRAGAAVVARDDKGLTPLGLAIRNARWRLAANLLELGAGPATLEEISVLPLVCDWANYNLFGIAPVSTLEGCLEAGADVNARYQRTASDSYLFLPVLLTGFSEPVPAV